MLKAILFICWIISCISWLYFFYKIFNTKNKDKAPEYMTYMWISVAVMNIFALLIKFAV